MKFLLSLSIFLNITQVYFSAPTTNNNSECRDISEILLTEILGPAYNTRYMSIKEPLQRDYYLSDLPQNGENVKRRTQSNSHSFYVDNDYTSELSEEPAWIVKHSNINNLNDSRNNERSKRNNKIRNQWQCDSAIKWIDLGPDYFPRYLRTVECITKYCWYGHYKCKPKSFAVKILKRRRDKCINIDETGFSMKIDMISNGFKGGGGTRLDEGGK